jgi:hypothetical protein
MLQSRDPIVVERDVRVLFDSLVTVQVLFPESEMLNFSTHLTSDCGACGSHHRVLVQICRYVQSAWHCIAIVQGLQEDSQS